MKRIIASLIAVLMLAFVTPVVFAANMDFTGEISSEVKYSKEFSGVSELELSANLGNNLKAGLNFGKEKQSFPWNPANMSIKNI